jgi:hypothetical protein
MNQGQTQFYNFFMNMVKEDKKEEAKEVLLKGFEKQAEGTFDKAYLESVMPTYFSLIKPECESMLKEAMAHFAQNL